jgi:hypothetical protein
MAEINEQDVIDNTSLYIPDGNVLTNDQMLVLVGQVITRVGNDDSKLPQVQCEFLRDLATVNLNRAAVDVGGLTSERVGDHARGYSPSHVNDAWKNFRDNIGDTCRIFGYDLPYKSGVFISPGERNDPLKDCPNISTLSF